MTVAREQVEQDPGALVDALNGLTSAYCYRRAYTEARPVAEEALERARKLPPEGSLTPLALAVTQQAVVSYSLGDYRQAGRGYQEAAALYSGLWGNRHPGLAPILTNLGLARRRLDDPEGAQAAYQRALKIQLDKLGPEHPALAATYNNIGGVHRARGQGAAAEASYRRARELIANALGAGHWRVTFLDIRLANTRIDQGAAAEAEGTLRTGLRDWRERFGDHWVVPFAEGVLGEAIAVQDRFDEAEALLVPSFEALLVQPQQRRREEALERLEALYAAAGTPEKAAAFRRRLEKATAEG